MKWQKMNYMMLVASFCAIAGIIEGKVALQQDAQLYSQGRLAGRVEAIMSSSRLSREQKEKLLRNVLADYEKLGLSKSTDAQQIRAHLGLAVEQVKSSHHHVVSSKRVDDDAPLATASLGDDVDDASSPSSEALINDLTDYGMHIIQQAQPYSDRFSLVGVPAASQHRGISFSLLMKRASSDEAIRLQVQGAKEVSDSIAAERLVTASGLARFIARFKSHIQRKYASDTNGLEDEVMFKVLQNLTYASEEPVITVGKKVGDFLKSFNGYMKEKLRISVDELDFSMAQWGQMILGENKVLGDKLKLLLVSFSMEELKQDLKREPLIKKIKMSIAEQMTQGVALLAEDGVVLDAESAKKPVAVAMQCSEVVQRKLNEQGGQLTPEARKLVDKYLGIADQISYLVGDYDIVIREMADARALDRMRGDIAKLPVAEQQLLKQSSTIDKAVLDELLPDLGQNSTFHMSELESSEVGDDVDDEQHVPVVRQKSGPNKKVMILVAIGVLIAGALLYKFKSEALSWFGGLGKQ